MRGAVIGMGVLLAALAGGWLGAETMAADRVAMAVAQDPALEAGTVRPLRDPRAIGVSLQEVAWRDPALGVALPWARLSLSPAAPLTARLELPDSGRITQGGRALRLGWTAPVARLSVAPLSRMAFDRLDLRAADVSLDDQPLAGVLSLQGRLAPIGGDAPRDARAAYELQLALSGLEAGGLALLGLDPGPLPGPFALRGPLRVWLDGTPSATGAVAPRMVGWQAEGLELQAGPVALRLTGRLVRDAQGLAEGQLALYSDDSDALIGAAADLGLIPAQARLLLRAGLMQLAQAPLDETLPGPVFPGPAEGELRLPVILRDGQMILGGVPVGPAPAI